MDDRPFQRYRSEFPIAEKYIYLDHSGVAPVSLRVKRAIEHFLEETAEGAAFHYPKWAEGVSEVRSACARLINADQNEIAFVKSTSHGLSIVAEGLGWKPGDNILIYEKEFPSNIYPWLNLKRKGVDVKVIPSCEGRVLLADIDRLMDSRTRLVSISSVQFSNGFRVDLGQLGELFRKRKILLCVDAIQSLGLIPMDVRKFNIDFLAADGHKWILGPEGIGIFYCRKDLAERLAPPLIGWKCVQNEFAFEHPDFCLKSDALRFEEGSMNLLGILGLGAAVDLLLEIGIENIEDRVLGLGATIIKKARSRGFTLLTPDERQARGGNITFTGNFDPAGAREALLKKNVMVNVRAGGLRVSPHFYNTDDELERFFTLLDKII